MKLFTASLVLAAAALPLASGGSHHGHHHAHGRRHLGLDAEEVGKKHSDFQKDHNEKCSLTHQDSKVLEFINKYGAKGSEPDEDDYNKKMEKKCTEECPSEWEEIIEKSTKLGVEIAKQIAEATEKGEADKVAELIAANATHTKNMEILIDLQSELIDYKCDIPDWNTVPEVSLTPGPTDASNDEAVNAAEAALKEAEEALEDAAKCEKDYEDKDTKADIACGDPVTDANNTVVTAVAACSKAATTYTDCLSPALNCNSTVIVQCLDDIAETGKTLINADKAAADASAECDKKTSEIPVCDTTETDAEEVVDAATCALCALDDCSNDDCAECNCARRNLRHR